LSDAQLATALGALGRAIAYPPAPDVRAAVLARIARPRPVPWWRAFASVRYGFLPALATLVLILVAVLTFSPEARAAAVDILRLRGVEIFRGPVPTASPAPSRSGAATATPSPSLGLGERVTLEVARQRAGYPVLVPADPLLGEPDEIWVRATGTSTQVSFVYRTRAGVPVSPQAGVSAIVTEFGGGTVAPQFFGKVIDQNTRLESLQVNGGPGFWLEGQPHQFFYEDRVGIVTESLRLAGNTLIWQQGSLVVRIEAQVDRATALRIAASMR